MQDYSNVYKNVNHKNLMRHKSQCNWLLNELLEAEYKTSNLKQILNASSEAILITTPDSKIIYVNPAWEKLTGYTLLEVAGKTPKFLQSGETPKTYYKKLWHNLEHNQPFTNDALINKRKDGSTFPAHSTIFPVTRAQSVLYYVQFLYDISERLNQEKEKQQLLSLVAHELKTPITVLKLIIAKYSNPQKRRTLTLSDWENIDQELDRITALIDESLDFARIESNRLNLQLSLFDLNTLIEEVIEQLSLMVQERRIFFSTVPNLVIEADIKRIKQVLINLISNAIKFSPNNKKVNVSALVKNTHVVISVRDYGIGIADEDQALIFDRSYQVQKRTAEGLGLGLYISKEIIKKHHGRIWVKSIEGKGSTFSFTLPLKKSS